MSGPTLSRYTPSLMAADLLERLFVARDRTLDEVVRRVEAASTSVERNHTLLVGPRGAGKTHLVSLVYHRVTALAAEGLRVQVAWLPEDPWTIVSYRHVLAEVVSRLEPAIGGEVPRSADELERLLAARAGERGPVVVIVENLDQILDAIGDDGQQRLRHLLQAQRSLLLVATSTTLDRPMADPASPFYGFFTTTRLEPFSVDEAAAMLTVIARESGDEELVAYLASDEGRARLRTIEHLAGGQPRMWAALASALTVEGLDDLVDLLLTRFDDLTPYYQEQLRRLSGHQRLVVAALAEADRPLTVKDLAERLEIDQRSLGKTVSDLVDRRWIAEIDSPVTVLLDKRFTYYELAEPMARLAFQIKDTRGEPLRLIVDFLKHWFDPEDLEASTGRVAVAYVHRALSDQTTDEARAAVRSLVGLTAAGTVGVELLGEVDDALAGLELGDADGFLALPSSVRRAVEAKLERSAPSAVRLSVHSEVAGKLFQGSETFARPWLRRAEELTGAASGSVRSRANLAQWQILGGELDSATATVSALQPGDSQLDRYVVLFARFMLGTVLVGEGRASDALDAVRAWRGDIGPVRPDEDLFTAALVSLVAFGLLEEGRDAEALDVTDGLVDALSALHPVARAGIAFSRLLAMRRTGHAETAELEAQITEWAGEAPPA